MSIQVQQLTKVYGSQRAVDSLSFTAEPGQIVGFIGANGAGKSTTMKMMTGYLLPTEGEAVICGHKVTEAPLEVRKCVGYLPESNPLYREMYVQEYLQYVAGLYKLDRKRDRVAEAIDKVGLTREQHKRIGALSKGYRQRVGIAQAILHDPQVLILDEPLSGLDPNQRADIRELIRSLRQDKTLLLSSHDLTELQMICDRVIIIDRGRLVSDDATEVLVEGDTAQQTMRVAITFLEEVALDRLKRIPGVQAAEPADSTIPNRFYLTLDTDVASTADLFKWAVAQQITLTELSRQSRSLEEVFKAATRG